MNKNTVNCASFIIVLHGAVLYAGEPDELDRKHSLMELEPEASSRDARSDWYEICCATELRKRYDIQTQGLMYNFIKPEEIL